jgi:predicted Ser/Thr protein kinase
VQLLRFADENQSAVGDHRHGEPSSGKRRFIVALLEQAEDVIFAVMFDAVGIAHHVVKLEHRAPILNSIRIHTYDFEIGGVDETSVRRVWYVLMREDPRFDHQTTTGIQVAGHARDR